MYLPKDQGGQRLVDLIAKERALKIQWIFRARQELFFNVVSISNLIPQLGQFIWQCNLQVSDIPKVIQNSTLWSDVLEAWCIYNYSEPQDIQEILHQIIWCSSLIWVGDRPIIWNDFLACRVNRVMDLVDAQGKLYTKTQLESKYSVEIDWLKYNSLILLKHVEPIIDNPSLSRFDQLDLTKGRKTRKVYTRLISNLVRLKHMHKMWQRRLQSEIDYESFFKYFLNVFFCTISTKLRDFHYLDQTQKYM